MMLLRGSVSLVDIQEGWWSTKRVRFKDFIQIALQKHDQCQAHRPVI
jgi:hypothetical protein